MMHPTISGLVALAVLFSAASARAQENAASASQCELHVWPSEGLASVLQRAGDNLLASSPQGYRLYSPKNSIDNNSAVVRTFAPREDAPLSPPEQISVLANIPLTSLLGLAGYRVVMHDGLLDSRTIRTVKTRYFEMQAACYADLVLDDVVYSREYARGQNLKTFFCFCDFASQASPVRSFGTWTQTKLRIFSIDPPNSSAAALEEIASALRSNATAFSALLAKRPPATGSITNTQQGKP
ncbi:hypothetical protein ACVWZA_003078 [Sphingomonas sp. UYAg733]